MNAAWLSLCGIGLLAIWLLRDALTDMCKEEIRTRLARLPYAVLKVVALRTPRSERQDVLNEWSAELDFILSETDGLPLTRLLRGICYSVSLLGLMLPFATTRDVIAAYLWKVSRRLHHVSCMGRYVRAAVTVDALSMLAAGLLAFRVSIEGHADAAPAYLAVTFILPVVWLVGIEFVGGYDDRFIGSGPEEFCRILAVGLGLIGSVAVVAWVTPTGLSRSYMLIALPTATAVDLVARYTLRKELYKHRASGRCMQKVVAVGHEHAVADLVSELRRDPHHGLTVVGACVAQPSGCSEVAGVPVYGDLSDVTAAVRAFGADTVAVLACPEMDGVKLRSLAWELEKTKTSLCVAPSLLDVTGSRTTVRATAGLSLLHVDHPQLSGLRQVLKGLFDRGAAGAALIMLFPLILTLAAAIRLSDGGPALFTQTRFRE